MIAHLIDCNPEQIEELSEEEEDSEDDSGIKCFLFASK